MPNEVKGTVLRDIQIGDHKLANDEQITNLIVWLSFLTYNALCFYGEYAKQRKKPEKFTCIYQFLIKKKKKKKN
jgi:hypothetical protein